MPVLKNEGKACDVVARWLEERTDTARTDVCLPEKCGIGPPVDLRLFLGSQEFAFEHTLIEPFSGFFKTGNTLEEVIEPIKSAVAGKLPGPAHYTLLLPTDPHVEKSEIESFNNKVTKLILDRAPILYERSLTSNATGEWVVCASTEVGFPYDLEMSCSTPLEDTKGNEPGILGIVRLQPENLQQKRKDRLRTALRKKSTKLNRCKETRTVLVLENQDIALTSAVSVCQIVQNIVIEDRYNVDEIVLVDTTSWTVWPIKLGDDFPRVNFCQWNPEILNDISASECPRHTLISRR